MKAKITIGVVLTLAMMCFAMAAMAQNQDANPYGHRYYNDHNDYRMYGTNVLPRTDHANLDTLTSVIKGDLRYDTINAVMVYYDGSTWVNVISGGGNTLDEAYDSGGAGAGREIVADAGAVEIVGTDGNYAINTTGDVILHSESDSTGIFLGQYDFEAFGSVPVSINGSGTYEWLGDWGFLNYTGVDNLNESVGATMLGFSTTTGDYRNIRLDSLGISIIRGNLLNGSIASITLPASQPVISVGLKTSESAFVVIDSIGGINMIAEEGGNIGIGTSTPDTTLHLVGKLKYVDGTQGDGHVLTSDASGNATWQDAATLDFSTLPSYSDNATAVVALGAGKLYYTDVAGEYMLKVTH